MAYKPPDIAAVKDYLADDTTVAGPEDSVQSLMIQQIVLGGQI
jgi:hypothetical protein